MRISFKSIGICGAILLLGGCAVPPSLPHAGNQASITRIVDRVQCEVYEAIQLLYKYKDHKGKRTYGWVENYIAQASLSLTINAEGQISPEISLLGPFGSGDFSFGIGGGVTAGANRIATYDFLIPFKVAQGYDWCRSKSPNALALLEGELGFGEWFTRVLLSRNKNDPFDRPEKLSHKLEFVLDGNLKITPAYVLTRSKGTGVFSIGRKDTHTLDMVLVYNDPDAEFDKVCVINAPNVVPEDCLKKNFKTRTRVSPEVRLKLERGHQDLQLRGIQQQLQIRR